MKLLIEKKHRASKGGWKPRTIVKGMANGRADPKQAQKELAKRVAEFERNQALLAGEDIIEVIQ